VSDQEDFRVGWLTMFSLSKRRLIKYLKRGFLYAQPITDLDSFNAAVLRWCDEVANEKEHGTTREVASGRLADERKALGPLPEQPVPLFLQVTRRVRKDSTFVFETNQYSAPHAYARKTVTVRVF